MINTRIKEQGSNEEIVEFACTRFQAEYPIFDKVSIACPNMLCLGSEALSYSPDVVSRRQTPVQPETLEEFQQMRTRLTEHEEKERFLMEQIEAMRRDQEATRIAQEDRMIQERLQQEERMRQERLEQEERMRQEVAAVRKEQDAKFLQLQQLILTTHQRDSHVTSGQRGSPDSPLRRRSTPLSLTGDDIIALGRTSSTRPGITRPRSTRGRGH